MHWKQMLSAAAAAIALSTADANGAEPIKLAYLAPLSGTFALTFEEGLKQFRAAIDEVNARGGVLGGRQLVVVPYDNKGTPQETQLVLNRAIDEGSHYILATISSIAITINEALIKYNARHPESPVLYLNYDAREPSLTEERCNFWHFRFEPHADMNISVLTDSMAADASVKKVYFLHQDYAWGQSVRRVALEMLKKKRPGIEIVGDDLIALGKVKDFTPYVAKIRASGADTVFTSTWGSDLQLLVKAAEQANLPAYFYTTHAWVVGTPSVIGAAAANRVKTLMTWHINAAPAEWEKKLLRYEEKYQTKSHLDFIPAWQTIEMFVQALEKAGSDSPLKVAYALEGMHWQGPAGDTWMRKEDHQLLAPQYIATFVKSGQPGVKHDVEGTGFGWKTEMVSKAADAAPPIRCNMERPAQ